MFVLAKTSKWTDARHRQDGFVVVGVEAIDASPVDRKLGVIAPRPAAWSMVASQIAQRFWLENPHVLHGIVALHDEGPNISTVQGNTVAPGSFFATAAKIRREMEAGFAFEI